MDAARDGLNEARLADDGDEEVAQSAVDCSTVPRCRRSASLSSVSDYVVAEPRSNSCSPRAHDSSTDNIDDVDPTQSQSCKSLAQATADVEAMTTKTTPRSAPLLEQLVTSPCEVVAPVPSNSALSPPAAASDANGQSNLDKSFLQKLESFVSSVGQVATVAPLNGWIRRSVFPSRSGASAAGSIPVVAKRPGPAGICPYSLSTFYPSPAATDSSRPLDLSSKRTETSASVDSAPASHHRRVDLMQRDCGQGEVEGRFMDMNEVQPSGANSLACLERDFGEHSAIFAHVGSSRGGQRQAAAALTTRGGVVSRRGRTVVMPGLTAAAHTPAGARICPPSSITTPHAELHPPRSFVNNSRHPLTYGRTGFVGSKLEVRHPMMPTTTAATMLRCLQCGRTFFSLPELTLHMIQSAHYANLICAAAAYSVDGEEDCVVLDAYDGRQSSNVGVDRSTHKSGALKPPRGKGLTEMADGHREDHLYRSSSDIRRRNCVDTAVSPARSLDDESVSSAGLTETESLRSSTSSASPTSPSYEHAGSGATDDDLMIMSRLLRLQPLLSRTVLDNMQSGAAVPGHIDWTALGLSATEERRQLARGRSSKTSLRELDRSPAADSLPIDMRSQRPDGNRHRDSQSRQMSFLTTATKIPTLASRQSSTVYLEKLLDDIRGCRKSLDSSIKRSASSKWYNGKHRTKKHRTHSISSSDCDQARYDEPRPNGNRSVIISAAAPASGEVCLRKRDEGIHGCREAASNVKKSPPVNQDHYSSQRQEMADCARQLTSKEPALHRAVIDGGTTNSPVLSVNSRDVNVPTSTGRDFRRSSVDKDQSEYAVRFGKYYRLAQELSSKTD